MLKKAENDASEFWLGIIVFEKNRKTLYCRFKYLQLTEIKFVECLYLLFWQV